MILCDSLNSGSVNALLRLGNGSTDSGSNYARRHSVDGASDSTATSQTYIFNDGAAGSYPKFTVGYLANLSDKEKLGLFHNVMQNTAGAANAPKRAEAVGKWTYTSNPLDTITNFNSHTGSFATGAEVVVLGWDPADTHTSNFWEELTFKDWTGTADTVTTDTFTAKKYLWIQSYVEGTSSLRSGAFRLNGDTAGNYAIRRSRNGGADSTFTSNTAILPQGGQNTTNYFMNLFIINNASNEKLIIEHIVEFATAGAGTAPSRHEIVGKWANTSNQITTFSNYNDDSGDLTTVKTKVWGAD